MSSIKDPLRIPGIREVWEGMRCSVWWPGVSSEVKQFVENSHKWAREALQKQELLPIPKYPWQVFAIDLLELGGKHNCACIQCIVQFCA